MSDSEQKMYDQLEYQFSREQLIRIGADHGACALVAAYCEKHFGHIYNFMDVQVAIGRILRSAIQKSKRVREEIVPSNDLRN